ncbi:energy transducer TonB [Haliea sp. E17]|uniref:energy transducer TonB n=1 Tax=Haliea sp. E17 TaxID=3401576 RepID=UPI003AAE3397
MYYLHHIAAEQRRMRYAIAAALALHVVVVSVVSFRGLGGTPNARQIEVTLTTRNSDRSPDDARHIAQSNQLGSGQQAERDNVTSPDAALPLPDTSQPRSAPPRTEETVSASGELLSSVAAAPRSVTPREQRDHNNPAPGLSPEARDQQQQMAAQQAQPDRQLRSESRAPRVRRLTGVSAKQAADAAYLLDWRQRLEAVGNKYYPEASVRYGMYGNLKLLVAIRSDGSLEDVKVLESSGYAVLDEAAIKIVRMAAPYSPFPDELAATTDMLEIVRTWQFQQNELGSN